MKRAIIIILLVLLLLPGTTGKSTPTRPVLDNPMSLSTDGDTSTESITSFSETLADDTLFYPDAFLDNTNRTAIDGEAQGDFGIYNDYTYTHDTITNGYAAVDNAGNDAYVIINFTVPTLNGEIDGIQYYTYGSAYEQAGAYGKVQIYDFTGDSWHTLVSYASTNFEWHNGSTYDPDYWDTNVSIRIVGEYTSGITLAYNNFTNIQFYYTTLSDSAHYAESFSDVSDWSTWVDATPQTDYDSGYIESPGDNAFDRIYSDNPSLTTTTPYYLEVRLKSNVSSTYTYVQVYPQVTHGGSGQSVVANVPVSTTWTTYRGIITISAVESVVIMAKHASLDFKLQFDYIRISPCNEQGWQHDCSTIEGTIYQYGANNQVNSDGDILNYTAVYNIEFDGFATSDFPFVEICITSLSGYWQLAAIIDTSYYTLQSTSYLTGTFRYNLKSQKSGDLQGFRLYGYTTVGSYVCVDYIKVYSIANYSYSDSSTTSNDVLYIDTSSDIQSTVDSGNIVITFDPTLAVASSSYPIYNLSTSTTAPEFSMYVSSWSTYSDDTRGSVSTGTVTTFRLRFDSTEDISAIKWIEDSTAPTIVRSSVNPSTPYEDDNEITLSAVVSDAVEVWKVRFNAIVYPIGFTDTDYFATEQSDNLWTYTFSEGQLIDGYYCFAVIGNDGNNENELDLAYAYLDFTVREAEIDIDVMTLLGAGSDFTMMTLSANINKDCTYTIYEESASSPETDTYTGSVTAPSFNLAWEKLDTTDTNVNFTIIFVNGTLSYNYTSQYQVAQTTFYIENTEQSESYETVTVSGYITKTCNYAVYDVTDTLQDSGSVDDNEFRIEFNKWAFADQESHFFAIMFTNGSSVTWFNSTYYGLAKEAGGYGSVQPSWASTFTFWTLFGVVLILMAVTADLLRGRGNVPNVEV